ncbi:Uncharacterised protein [Serratia rubidaea]|uniref:Uncharacterized protein n=1 Tax=Serratia rubidaea TaxID=61652 RepID=A0A447QTN1_SERRU|nr:Uncharacterised protein [Serratia rubidaea]
MSYTSVKTFSDVVADFSDITFSMDGYSTAVPLTSDFKVGDILDADTGAAATAATTSFIILLTDAKAGQTEVTGVDRNVVIIQDSLNASQAVIDAAKAYFTARDAGVRFK